MGENISYFTGGNKEHVIKMHFGREVGDTDKDVIERAVARLQKETFPGGVPITDAISVKVVNSDNLALSGTPYVFSTLELTDMGDSNSIGLVQAQYPNYRVELTGRDGLVSTYTILHPDSVVLPAYVSSTKSYLKDCEECAAGYALLSEGGVIYSVSIEDEGQNLSTSIDDLPGFVVGSVVKKGQDGNNPARGIYTVVIKNDLTSEDIAAFASTTGIKSTSIITKVGTVREVCYSSATTSTDWIAGKTCYASTEGYKIQLKDDDCDGSRLAELQAYYPELSIFSSMDGMSGGCQSEYFTQVITNLVCEECSDIFLQPFISKAPEDFDFTSWELIPEIVDTEAKMGIRLTGKPFTIMPTDISLDQIPFIETSASINVSGGYVEEVNFSFDPVFADIFKVTRLSRKQDRDSLGYHLLFLEKQSRAFFDGELTHNDNLYAKQVLGEESVIKFDKQYVQYAITVQDSKPSQSMGRHSDIAMEYSIWAELGQHAEVEAYVNKLAVKAGLDPVQALAGTPVLLNP
jgi:hypothetical protein